MRISITIIDKNPVHVRFVVHVNGASAGQLCLRVEEWDQFMAILQPDKIYDNTTDNENTTK